jgi:hypothetical protein
LVVVSGGSQYFSVSLVDQREIACHCAQAEWSVAMNQKLCNRESSPKYFAGRLSRWAFAFGTAIAIVASPFSLLADEHNSAEGGALVHDTPAIHGDNNPAYEPYGWEPPAYGPDCGFGCPPTWRIQAEYLLWNREGESNLSLSSGSRLTDFEYEEGGRITIGHKFDCAIGWEAVYTGPFEWIQTTTATGAGTLNTVLQGNGVNLSAFNGANLHTQTYRSRLQSFEASQKWWGWDVITTSAGVRYLDIEENYFFGSVDANGDLGTFNIRTRNLLVGPQLGIEMLFPIGNISFDTNIKGALMANFGESSVSLVNAGVSQINNNVDDIEFAALVQGGYFVRYAITPRIIARVGYEYLWIYGLGIAPEQINTVFVGASTGRSFDGQGDTFYHGAAGGIEIIF